METNVRYTIAGIFVIVLFAFVTMAIIWLSAGFSVESYRLYVIKMKESVSGLTVDSAVEFNGVNVGTVKNIAISAKDPELVEVLIRIRSSTPITEGTSATMNMRGLTGVTFVALRDTGTNNSRLTILPGEEYPMIKTAPSLLMRFDQALTQLTTNFNRISQSIEKLLNDENLNSIKYTLRNLRTATEQVTPLLQTGFEVMDRFNRETLPASNQIISHLEHIVNNVQDITLELKDNPAVLIRGKTTPPLGPGEN